MDQESTHNSTREEGELSDDDDICGNEIEIGVAGGASGSTDTRAVTVCDAENNTNSNANVVNCHVNSSKIKPDASSNKHDCITAKSKLGALHLEEPVDSVVMQGHCHWKEFGEYSNYRGLEVYQVNGQVTIPSKHATFSDNMRDKLNFYGGKRGRNRASQNSRNRHLQMSGFAKGKPRSGNDNQLPLPVPLMLLDVRRPTPMNFSLVTNPPPPPPPPPPPLPSSPPPNPPPPPLPPVNFAKKGKLGAKDNRSRTKSAGRLRRAASPIGDIEDTDYIDLLLEYKQIQQQLQSIRKQEQKVARLSSQHEALSVRKPTASESLTNRCLSAWEQTEEIIEISDSDNAANNDTKKGDVAQLEAIEVKHEKIGSVKQDAVKNPSACDASPTGSTKQVPTTAEEEEELEVMELRLAALASAAKATHHVPNDLPAVASFERQRSYDRYPLKRRQRRRSSRGGKRRSIDHHHHADRRNGSDSRQNDLRREHNEILALDDPREQYRRFLQLTMMPSGGGGGGVCGQRNASRNGRSNNQISAEEVVASAYDVDMRISEYAPTVRDNYEPVEMDIDSNSGSPICVSTPAESADQVHMSSGADVWSAQLPCAVSCNTAVSAQGMAAIRQQDTDYSGAMRDIGHLSEQQPPTEIGQSLAEPMAVQHVDPLEQFTPIAACTELHGSPQQLIEPIVIQPEERTCPLVAESSAADEDEEALLRAQLLKSMVTKQQEKARAASKNTVAEKTKKIHVVNNKPLRKSKATTNTAPKHKIPIHKRVIITLGAESSDSDQHDEPVAPSATGQAVLPPTDSTFTSSLDLFLKEARQSAEAISKQGSPDANPSSSTTTPNSTPNATKCSIQSIANDKTAQDDRRTEQVNRVKAIAEKIKQERQLICRHDNAMATLQRQLRQRRLSHRSAEQKAQKLREHLAVAERIAKAHAQPIEKLTQRIAVLGQQLTTKRERVSRLVQSLGMLEQKTFGKVMNLSETSPQKVGDDAAAKMTSRKKHAVLKRGPLSPEVLASEKQRLQQLERRYAEMIRQFKQTQQQPQQPDRGTDCQMDDVTPAEPVAHIATEERMTFSEVTEEDAALVPRRRRSLIDMSACSTPNLPVGSSVAPPAMTETGGSEQRTTVKCELVAPTAQQLAKLRRLHKENASQLTPFQNLVFADTSPFAEHIQMIADAKACHLLNTTTTTTSSTEPSQHSNGLKVYHSELLRFRSYRLNPYYRTKEKRSISSLTCSHRIQPNVALCRFDLMGKCNDDKCVGQHFADMQLSKEQMLSELVSYNPAVAGITVDMPASSYPKHIGEYIEKCMKLSHKMGHEAQCVLLAGRVNEQARHVPPHVIIMEPRKWRPLQVMKENVGSIVEEAAVCQQLTNKPDNRWRLSRWEEENVVGEADVRYWLLSGADVMDMESGVLAQPHDDQLWLQLAYRKLHNPKGTFEQNLEQALNVMSRALEKNHESSTLWLHYLRLYGRRSDCTDLARLHKQALHYAPSHVLYWKCLQCADSFSSCNRLCVRLRQWLLNQRDMTADLLSHRLLEAFLYQVSVHVHTGRYVNAVHLMKATLTDKPADSFLCRHLKWADRVIVWLTYIHLMEFHQLPPTLFDASDNSCARLVSKEPWLFPWKPGGGTKMDVDSLRSLLQQAQAECQTEDTHDDDDGGVILPLLRNLLQLHMASNRWDAAVNDCRSFISSHQHSVPGYMELAKLYLRQSNFDTAVQVLSEALPHNACSAELYYLISSVNLLKGNVDGALETLEKCAISFFEIDDFTICDPNILYGVLLSQPSGDPGSLAFHRKPSVTAEYVTSQQLYLWLNYSVLLELQGEKPVDAYETALSSLGHTQHLYIVWQSYLRYLYRVTCSSANAAASFRALSAATRRCLVTMPSRVNVANDPTRYHLCYDRHNDIVSLYMKMLPEHQKMSAYESFIALMPANVKLQQWACEHAFNKGDISMARGICFTALNDHPKNLHLWRMNLFLAYKKASYAEIRQIFEQATNQLPFMLTLWKDFMLFEMAHSSMCGVKQISNRCRQLSLNMGDFVKALLK